MFILAFLWGHSKDYKPDTVKVWLSRLQKCQTSTTGAFLQRTCLWLFPRAVVLRSPKLTPIRLFLSLLLETAICFFENKIIADKVCLCPCQSSNYEHPLCQTWLLMTRTHFQLTLRKPSLLSGPHIPSCHLRTNHMTIMVCSLLITSGICKKGEKNPPAEIFMY